MAWLAVGVRLIRWWDRRPAEPGPGWVAGAVLWFAWGWGSVALLVAALGGYR